VPSALRPAFAAPQREREWLDLKSFVASTPRGAMAGAGAHVPYGNPFIHLDDRNRMTTGFRGPTVRAGEIKS
jgi:hypothetical protein